MRRSIIAVIVALATLALAASVALGEGCAPLPGDRPPFIDCPPPLLIKGTVMIPMRAMFQFMAATVQYHAETSAITAKAFDRTLNLWLHNPKAKVGGRYLTMQVPPTEVNGSTYIPLRFVATGMGATVGWSEKTKTVTVCYCRRKGTMVLGRRGISAIYCG